MKPFRIVASLVGAVTLTMAGDISVENPFVEKVEPNIRSSAAFMTIKNSGSKTVNLVSATSDASAITELCTYGKGNGVMATYKYKVDKIEAPAKGEAHIGLMGAYVMLIGLNKQP